MRTVRVLWQRHIRNDAISDFGAILQDIPRSVPITAYEAWLHDDVIPWIFSNIEWDRGGHGQRALQEFVAWVLERVETAAANEDIEMALKFISFIRASDSDATTDVNDSFQWTAVRLQAKEDESGASVSTLLDRLDSMSRQLEEIQHLKSRHAFTISLGMFSEETPSTIAMSMLDRISSADVVRREVDEHVKVYLSRCRVQPDTVMCDYITEAVESTPNPPSADQAKLLAIIDEVENIEARAKALLVFFDAL
ncbi:hypothetical protein PINS_up000804, partial [Pythium insidiosum]